MNDTTKLIVQSLGKVFAGFLLAHGIASDSEAQGFVAVLIGLGSYVWAHRHFHGTIAAVLDSAPPASRSFKSLVLVLLLALPASLCLQGCRSPQQAAFAAVKVPTVTAQQAVGAWNDYVKTFHPPASQSLAVREAYLKYQAADLGALDLARIASDAAGSTNGLVATVRAEAQTKAASDALADLIALLQQYGVKL